MDYLDKLIELRIDNDLSQKTIGKIINKSQQGYDHIEKRRAKLSIEDFAKLCNYYKVSADDLLNINNTPTDLWKSVGVGFYRKDIELSIMHMQQNIFLYYSFLW